MTNIDYSTWGSGGGTTIWTGTDPNYTFTGNWLDSSSNDTIEVTLDLPDPLIDWLPYHYTKYIPTWHLVRSYD